MKPVLPPGELLQLCLVGTTIPGLATSQVSNTALRFSTQIRGRLDLTKLFSPSICSKHRNNTTSSFLAVSRSCALLLLATPCTERESNH